jgi:DNA-binding transcriptional regulator YiaG
MGNKRPKPQRLAAKLLAIREHLGMSQMKLAKLIDPEMSHTRISEYEIGRREPNLWCSCSTQKQQTCRWKI